LLDDRRRCQARARLLKVLEVQGRGLELCFESLDPARFTIQRSSEHRRECQRGGNDGDRHYEWPITIAPMRQRPLASDATPMDSMSCGSERQSHKERVRR